LNILVQSFIIADAQRNDFKNSDTAVEPFPLSIVTILHEKTLINRLSGINKVVNNYVIKC